VVPNDLWQYREGERNLATGVVREAKRRLAVFRDSWAEKRSVLKESNHVIFGDRGNMGLEMVITRSSDRMSKISWRV